MIVDCHTHINCPASNVGPSEHWAAMETVDVSIVLAPAAESSQQVNKELSDYVGGHREKLVGFAFIDPVQDDVTVKNVKLLTEKLDLKGVVLYCSGCGFHPAHTKAMQFYESASELNLPIFFHNAGKLTPDAVFDYAQPFLLDEIARTFPGLKMVIGTMGMPFLEQTLSMVAKHENVYADLTIYPDRVWSVYNTVVAAHEQGVMNKLLFGSGFPHGNATECIETLLGFNKLLADTDLPSVPRSDIKDVIERNTLKTLGIQM